jgi:hypothetical protein
MKHYLHMKYETQDITYIWNIIYIWDMKHEILFTNEKYSPHIYIWDMRHNTSLTYEILFTYEIWDMRYEILFTYEIWNIRHHSHMRYETWNIIYIWRYET